MFKKILLIALILFGFISFPYRASAQTYYPSRAVRVVTLSPEKGEQRNFYPVWGEKVEIKNEVNGDIFVAGGEVVIDGIVNGDLLAAAGSIIINGEINNRGTNIRRPDPTNPQRLIPLTKGRILLQAEGAEISYRKIEIKPLTD